jgi:hypothetical protein
MRTRFEVINGSQPSAPPTPGAGSARGGAIATGLILLGLLAGGAWLTDQRLKGFLSTLDELALGQASRTLQSVLDRQREQLVSEVTVLADDNRIRATVLAPTFDENTVRDVLEDLRKSSGASLLAVLDSNGKVRAVSGAGGLSEVNLGSSTAVKAAFTKPTSDIWTLPDQVQVIGLAPIRSGDQTPALLVKGLPLGKSQLATVEATMGVFGAVFIGEKMAISSGAPPELVAAFQAAGRVAEGTVPIADGQRQFLARIGRTGDAATSARVAWLVPYHHQSAHARVLSVLIWSPIPFGALMLLLILASRRTNGGSP